MDEVMTTSLTLTLSVGWNVSCKNDGSVTQTVTLIDYNLYRAKLKTVWKKIKTYFKRRVSIILSYFSS